MKNKKLVIGIIVTILFLSMEASYNRGSNFSMAPQPFIVNPINGSIVSNNFEVRVVEMNNRMEDIMLVNFYIHFGNETTYYGSDEDWSNGWNITIADPASFGIANHSYFRVEVEMIDYNETAGYDMATYVYDPIPPIPEFAIQWSEEPISGTILLNVKTKAKDVNHADFFTVERSSKDKRQGMEPLNQFKFGVNPGNVDPFAGGMSCGPAAAASCLSYWDQYTDANKNRPYDALYNENTPDADGDGYKDGLEQMARDLYDDCKTNKVFWNDADGDGVVDRNELNLNGIGVLHPGTLDGLLNDGLIKYIRRKGLIDKLVVKYYGPAAGQTPATMRKMWQEFLRCQDVIPFLALPGKDGDATTSADNYDHYVTMSYADYGSIIPGRLYANCQAKFMNPEGGITTAGAADLRSNSQYYGRIYADWNKDGKIGNNEYATLKSFITVCPIERYTRLQHTYGNWTYIGSDYDGDDAWSISFNTTDFKDGIYLVKAILTDDSGISTSEITTLGIIDNGKPNIAMQQPRGNYLYIFNREIAPVPFSTIIIGGINIIADASDFTGISMVEFHINDWKRAIDDTQPYEWMWDETAIGKYTIKVVAHDNAGNSKSDEREVIIFNI